MKEYKTVEVPATTRKQLVTHVCDFCGKKNNRDDWEDYSYNVNETEIERVRIKHREGNNYGYDGCNTDEFSCDMCPNCFRNKLVPFLKSIAVNPIDYKEFDY